MQGGKRRAVNKPLGVESVFAGLLRPLAMPESYQHGNKRCPTVYPAEAESKPLETSFGIIN
jgi:hypothetical protein